jgi:hypothetical protein
MDAQTQRLANALRVLALADKTRLWLCANDPQALKQAVEALAEVGGEPICLFPDDHEPGHPTDMKFRCYDRVEWAELTEAEMVVKLSQCDELTCAHQFYHWQKGA